MGANATNAFLNLVTTLFDIVIWVWLLRILLQLVRADFYNPVSQMIWRVTRYPADWLRRVIPPIRRLDVASVITVIVISIVGVEVRAWIMSTQPPFIAVFLIAIANLLVQLVNLYTVSLVIQALLSWFGPGVNNPASNILYSLNEPLLRPIRRILPQTPGLDLSPLVAILALQFVGQLLMPLFLR